MAYGDRSEKDIMIEASEHFKQRKKRVIESLERIGQKNIVVDVAAVFDFAIAVIDRYTNMLDEFEKAKR